MDSPVAPDRRRRTAVCVFEGTLLRSLDIFPYFMLVAFEASGLIRFSLLLLLWPAIRLLRLAGMHRAALHLTVFVAVAGVKLSELKVVARAVLPKFYIEGMDVEAWRVFHRYDRKVVVTEAPSVMVEWFAREHLGADDVVGGELDVNRFGYATGFVVGGDGRWMERKVREVLGEEKEDLWLGREGTFDGSCMAVCKDQRRRPFEGEELGESLGLEQPLPVIFHDGRLVPLPTPSTALLIILWIPFGILLAAIRIGIGLLLPLPIIPYARRLFGGQYFIRGNPPPPPAADASSGVLFVCTHRTLMDPIILSAALRRRIPAVTYSISRLSEILSPIPTVRLSRNRDIDAQMIRRELAKGDLVVCPEGTTCREPFLLRFSALFAELTDRIVPVAMNYRVGFFHATTARGWKSLDPIFYFMNPRPVYEITFLNELPPEQTCATGRSPQDVANYVQGLLATTLGFQCTNYTRRDKYRVLAGNDGIVKSTPSAVLRLPVKSLLERARELLLGFVMHG